jgi:hypothetical protein
MRPAGSAAGVISMPSPPPARENSAVSCCWPPVRDHDVRQLTDAELAHARRELAASLALARPGSPVRVPILARLGAIDAELAARSAARPGQLPGSPRA